jgi:hypothetical protein
VASRISTGFHRLGIVIAAPCLIAAVILATSQWKNAPEDSGNIMTPGPSKAADQDPYAGYSDQPPALRQQAADPYASYSDQPPPTTPAPGGPKELDGAWGAAQPGYSEKAAAEIAAAAPRKPDYNLAWLLAAVGVVLYAVSRAAGWVITGFLGR